MDGAEEEARSYSAYRNPSDSSPSTPDDSSPDTASDQARWSYTGRSERGRVRSFTGHVTYLGGAAGERLRGELATVIHDLLTWAATARNAAEESSEHNEDTAA